LTIRVLADLQLRILFQSDVVATTTTVTYGTGTTTDVVATTTTVPGPDPPADRRYRPDPYH